MAEEKKFYKFITRDLDWDKLIKEDNTKQLLENTNILKLSEDPIWSYDSPLTLNEYSEALKLFKNNKSCGTDGLYLSFIHFWEWCDRLSLNSL